ncbi:helix-turn-helix domain-containing protein [Streptomyces sp. ODS28]|uniref:tetratricopeptide repeat protein n=1 Tax=Streptomyces sp. ODS28 TaxID=3136688 RepID=UPI0031E8EB8C
MENEQNGHGPALAELRSRLADGLARARLNQTQLARRADLGRTTVSEALSPQKPAPSAETVAALARQLELPVEELLELQRTATQGAGEVTADGPGRPIGEWEPHDLEVHPAGPGTSAAGAEPRAQRALPGYVSREHDRALAEAVRDAMAGRSRVVVLVGTSSTGKTRACWEAVQPLAEQGWRLWHPFDPTRAQAALEQLHYVRPRTVVWLNEAQHYLGDRAVGEQIAAALHHLTTSPERGPVLVLGTLWPEYAARYTALPTPDGPDLHSRLRELLAGHILAVPDTFGPSALAAASALAEDGDLLLADALTRARTDGRITQDLAGAPELLSRYQHASPAAQALLHAAMDARRLGVGLHLPQTFLTDATTDYLSQDDYDQLTDDWAERSYAELAELVHGKQAPLRRTIPRPTRRPPTPTTSAGTVAPQPAGPQFRLADYLEQHGRTNRRHLCPPASFWHAALTHLTHPDDLHHLTEAAERRLRLQWAHYLRHRAADHGHPDTLYQLAVRREEAGDRDGAEALARQAVDHGHPGTLHWLVERREEAGDQDSADVLLRYAANHGHPDTLHWLAVRRERAGDRDGAEALANQAANHGNPDALYWLAMRRKKAGDQDGAEALARQAANNGHYDALYWLAVRREEAGDQDDAEALARQAANHGHPDTLHWLAVRRERAGNQDSAEALARQAANNGHPNTLYQLAVRRERAGDQDGAEAMAKQAVDHSNTSALRWLAERRERAGDQDEAEALAKQAVDHGNPDTLRWLVERREVAGDQDSADVLLRYAANHGITSALHQLAVRRERAGDQDEAEALAKQAANRGYPDALYWLAVRREEAGDRDGAEALAKQDADHGNPNALHWLVERREVAGDQDSADVLLRYAANHGITSALHQLAVRRERAGDQDEAEALAKQAANHGNPDTLRWLAVRWEEAGDRYGAEALAKQAADHGNPDALYELAIRREVAGDQDGADILFRYATNLGDTAGQGDAAGQGWLWKTFREIWPYGLDPDGTPTAPWHPSAYIPLSPHMPPDAS